MKGLARCRTCEKAGPGYRWVQLSTAAFTAHLLRADGTLRTRCGRDLSTRPESVIYLKGTPEDHQGRRSGSRHGETREPAPEAGLGRLKCVTCRVPLVQLPLGVEHACRTAVA